MKYRGTVIGVIAFIIFVLLLNAVVLVGAAGIVVLLFGLTVTFNWSVFWWLLFGCVISLVIAVFCYDDRGW
jgi:hypothetical protein